MRRENIIGKWFGHSALINLVLLPPLLFPLVVPPLISEAVVLPSDALLQRLSSVESGQLAMECGHSTENVLQGGRKHPWAVSIMTKGRNKLGGTIISPYHILTVAHGFLRFDNHVAGACVVHGYRPIDTIRLSWTVAYGDDCIRPEANWPACSRPNIIHNKIRAIYIDDGFADGACVDGHDWAIVELQERIQFSTRVQPICLPLKGHPEVPNGQVLTVTSWGRPDAIHRGDALIREIPMRYNAECTGRPWADNMPTQVEDYLCAKALDPSDYRTRRTCHGDSGSGIEWHRPAASSSSKDVREISNPRNETAADEGSANGMKEKEEEHGRRDERRQHAAAQVMHAPLFIADLEFMRKWPPPIKRAAATRKRLTTNNKNNNNEKGGNAKSNLAIIRPRIRRDDEEAAAIIRQLMTDDDPMMSSLGAITTTNKTANESIAPSATATSNQAKSKQLEQQQEQPPKQHNHHALNVRNDQRQQQQSRRAAAEQQCELLAVTSYGSRQCASDELARFTRISKYLDKICALTGICYPLMMSGSGQSIS